MTSATPINFATTLDGILDSQLFVEQPAQGFRIAVDTILLAHFTPLLPHENLIEFGCGVGGALLALAHRVKNAHITGIEKQPELAKLCEKNIERNGFKDRVGVVAVALENLAPSFSASFDHVMMNPPFHDAARHDSSPLLRKKIANTEENKSLSLWIEKAHEVLRQKGTLTLIHRADRVAEICAILSPLFPEIEILPLLPKEDKPAKRIIIVARKNAKEEDTQKPTIKTRPPLILHTTQNTYTPEVEAILRGR